MSWSILLILILTASRAYYFNTNQIRDLESNTQAGLEAEAVAWSAYPGINTASVVYYCSGSNIYLVGGYNVLKATYGHFSRTYTNLPTHNTIYFSITFWYIDSWDGGNDKIILDFGTEQLNSPTIGNTYYHELCGKQDSLFVNGYQDFGQVKMTGSVSHFGSTLLLKIISNLNEPTTKESFGFRDINLEFIQLPSTIPKGYCTRTEASSPGYFPTCLCSEGFYTPCGSSNKCSTGCRSCYGPASYQCYECQLPYVWDGSQCITCDPNCDGCTGAGPDHCISCKPTKFIYKTTTCLDSCLPPLKQTSASPLTCAAACPAGQYIYEVDMNCHSCSTLGCLTCDDSKSICTSCAPGYFLTLSTYPSCTICPSGTYSTGGTVTSCSNCPPNCSSCSDQNTCQTCSPSFTLSNGFCSLILPPVSLDPAMPEPVTIEPTITRLHKGTSILSSYVPVIGILFSLPSSRTRLAATFVLPLIPILSYVKFLALSYSGRLKAFFEEPDPTKIPAPESLVLQMEPHIPIPNAGALDYSSFWVNSWNYLLITGALTFLLIVAQVFCHVKKKPRDSLQGKILRLIKELFVAQLLGGFTDVILFLIHRAQTLFGTNNNNDTISATPIVLRLDFSTGILLQLLLLIALLLLLKAKKPLLQAFGLDLFYQEEEHKGRDFQLLFILRNSLICLAVHPDLWLFDYPLAQTSILVLLSLSFLTYFCLRRPLKIAKLEAQCLVGEIILLFLNLTVLILAILDSLLKSDALAFLLWTSAVHNICEYVIIACNLAIGVVCLVFFCFSELPEIVKNLQKWKQQKFRIRRSVSVHPHNFIEDQATSRPSPSLVIQRLEPARISLKEITLFDRTRVTRDNF